MNGIEKGLEVTCSTGTRACEYRVGGYCISSAIYGLDSFPLLVPSYSDYSKVDICMEFNGIVNVNCNYNKIDVIAIVKNN